MMWCYIDSIISHIDVKLKTTASTNSPTKSLLLNFYQHITEKIISDNKFC